MLKNVIFVSGFHYYSPDIGRSHISPGGAEMSAALNITGTYVFSSRSVKSTGKIIKKATVKEKKVC